MWIKVSDNFAAILATSFHQSETFKQLPTCRNIWLICELSMLEDFEMEQKYVTNMH